MGQEPDPLPPPPFWRTRYFAMDVWPRRSGIDTLDVIRAIDQPDHSRVQPDGRIRRHVWVSGTGRWLRVVLLADRRTVHNAFYDRDFTP